jgi:hypothetical protein
MTRMPDGRILGSDSRSNKGFSAVFKTKSGSLRTRLNFRGHRDRCRPYPSPPGRLPHMLKSGAADSPTDSRYATSRAARATTAHLCGSARTQAASRLGTVLHLSARTSARLSPGATTNCTSQSIAISAAALFTSPTSGVSTCPKMMPGDRIITGTAKAASSHTASMARPR